MDPSVCEVRGTWDLTTFFVFAFLFVFRWRIVDHRLRVGDTAYFRCFQHFVSIDIGVADLVGGLCG